MSYFNLTHPPTHPPTLPQARLATGASLHLLPRARQEEEEEEEEEEEKASPLDLPTSDALTLYYREQAR